MSRDLAGLRIAIYARFSTDRQDASSILSQVAKARRWAAERGGTVPDDLVFEDHATSGAIRDRPGLGALMAAVRARLVDVVLVEDTGRLSRDTEDSAHFRKRLAYDGARLIAIDDGIDYAHDGAELQADMFAAFKAQQRRETATKTRTRLEERARAGFATGALPYGYRSRRVPYAGGEASAIEIDGDAAEIVREIFRLYAAGRSFREIATELNARAIPPPRASKPRAEQKWGLSTVRSILGNAAYSGRWAFGRRKWGREPERRMRRPKARPEPLHEALRPELALVDAETYARVRARLDATRTLFTGRRTVPVGARLSYALSGVLVCEHCGSPLQIHGGGSGDRRYYRCAGKLRGICDRGVTSLRESVARERLVTAIVERLSRKSARAALAAAIARALLSEDTAAAGRRELSRRIETNEARVRRLTLAIADGGAAASVLATIRELEAAVRGDRDALARLVDRGAAPAPIAVTPDEALAALDEELRGDPRTAREALRRLFDGGAVRVRVEEDGAIYARGGLLPEMLFSRSVACIAGAGFEPTTFGL